MKVISIAGEKGGTGKTTVAVNLAVEAFHDGLKVLLIDADIQGSAFMFHETRQETKTGGFQTIIKPSKTLHRQIQDFSNFDLIIIDTGGRDSSVFRSAITASDYVIVPIQAGQFDLWSLSRTVRIIEEATKFKDIRAKVLLNMVIPRAKIVKDVISALKNAEIDFFSTMLGLRVAYREAISAGLGVTEMNKKSKASEEVRNLWQEVKKWANLG